MTVITNERTQKLEPRIFQEFLRVRHIIIVDVDLPHIPCNRRGLLTLNGLKEIVKTEGIKVSLIYQSILICFLDHSTVDYPMTEERTVKDFIENLDHQNRHILRIVRMRSYTGVEPSLFSSDHTAWRETMSEPYCDQDDLAKLSSLRWTEAFTSDAVQFWKLPPSGFGMFLDIRSGAQWVIIASPEVKNALETDVDCFSRWDRYLQDFDPTDPKFCIETAIEAVRLEPGNRL